MEQTYELGRHLVGVRTNSEAFGAWLADTFSAYRSSEQVGAMYSVVIADEGDRQPGKRFHVVYKVAGVLARTFDLVELGRTLVSELESYAFSDWDEAIYARATVVSSDGVAAIVPNADLGHLTEISRQVERAGITLPPIGGGVAIDPDSGRLIPIPHRLPITDAAADRLARLAPPDGSSRRDGVPRREAPVSPRPDVEVVCLAGWGNQPLRPVSRALGVQGLASTVVNLDALGARALEGLARLTERAPCYELGFERSEQMIDALLAALRPGAGGTATA